MSEIGEPYIRFSDPNGKEWASICFEDGSVSIAEGYTPDDMARAFWVAVEQLIPLHLVHPVAERDTLREERDRLQAAVDKASSALHSSAYVGGPSEREAWQTVQAALGPLETQHTAQGKPTPPDKKGT